MRRPTGRRDSTLSPTRGGRRKEKCLQNRRETGPPVAAGKTVDQTGLEPWKRRPFGLVRNWKGRLKTEIPANLFRRPSHGSMIAIRGGILTGGVAVKPVGWFLFLLCLTLPITGCGP